MAVLDLTSELDIDLSLKIIDQETVGTALILRVVASPEQWAQIDQNQFFGLENENRGPLLGAFDPEQVFSIRLRAGAAALDTLTAADRSPLGLWNLILAGDTPKALQSVYGWFALTVTQGSFEREHGFRTVWES